MLHYYTYEYGAVSKDGAFHIYCSKDRLVGLVVRTLKRDGAWADGYSHFFLWESGFGSIEFDSEYEARLMAGRKLLDDPAAPPRHGERVAHSE